MEPRSLEASSNIKIGASLGSSLKNKPGQTHVKEFKNQMSDKLSKELDKFLDEYWPIYLRRKEQEKQKRLKQKQEMDVAKIA